MKSLPLMLSVVVLMSLSTVTFAQSNAQKSFDKLKTLAGSWEGHVTTVPQQADIEGKLMQVSLRVTSMGNALMHEMTGAGRPGDPITMLYLDGDRLLLTHYCDAGNRPRMAGKMSSRTILVTTHQVEEFQHVLTDLMFINRGRIVFACSMEEFESRYLEVMVHPEHVAAARALKPIHTRQVFGRSILLFEHIDRQQLAALGEVRTPSIADLFVAVIGNQSGAAQGAAR